MKKLLVIIFFTLMIFNPAISGNYGEENKAWTANDAKGFIKILSNAGKIYQSVENN